MAIDSGARENQAFTNSARTDGLQLRHWKKQKPSRLTNEDAMDVEEGEPSAAPEYEFAKYNISVTGPTYTEEQYEAHLSSNDWSKEETDYLLQTVKEWHQKWAIIIDRYDYVSEKPQPSISVNKSSSTALVKTEEGHNDPRTLEQLKARYYEIWSKTMALDSGGVQNMNETEFHLHETLNKYNPQTEIVRKNLAWALNNRSAEDIREEEYLLSELQRIMISAGKYEAERAEVRQRLEHAQSIGNNTNGLQTSNFAALNQLYNSLAAQDRSRKARHRLSINSSDLMHTPSGMGPNGTPLTATSHRDSLGSAGGLKRGSMSAPQPIRQLNAKNEKRFAVTTHDRLNSGIQFRSDRLAKMRQAKSQVQTQKIATALTELGVPDIIQLPTQRVIDAFEQLVAKVQRLIDARKVTEKDEGEVRIQGAMRDELKQTEDTGGDETKQGATTVNGAEESQAGDDKDAEGEEDEEDDEDEEGEDDEEGEEGEDDEEEDADGEQVDDAADDDGDEDADGDADGDQEDEQPAPDEMDVDTTARPTSSRSTAASLTSSHKRSASVMSMTSTASKRSRRGR